MNKDKTNVIDKSLISLIIFYILGVAVIIMAVIVYSKDKVKYSNKLDNKNKHSITYDTIKIHAISIKGLIHDVNTSKFIEGDYYIVNDGDIETIYMQSNGELIKIESIRNY